MNNLPPPCPPVVWHHATHHATHSATRPATVTPPAPFPSADWPPPPPPPRHMPECQRNFPPHCFPRSCRTAGLQSDPSPVRPGRSSTWSGLWPCTTCLPTTGHQSLQLATSLAPPLRMPGPAEPAGRQAPADPAVSSSSQYSPTRSQQVPALSSLLQPPPPTPAAPLIGTQLLPGLSSVTTQIYQPEKLKYFLFFIALLRLPCPVAVCPAHHLELVN